VLLEGVQGQCLVVDLPSTHKISLSVMVVSLLE
jgi:hypothetical protein